MKIKPIPPNPELAALIERAKNHKMTPEEIDAQRRSWVRGNMLLDNPEMTAEQVDAALGPSLSDLLTTARAEARNQALEEAAKLAERHGVYPELNVWAGGPEWYKHGKSIATAIRALIAPAGEG